MKAALAPALVAAALVAAGPAAAQFVDRTVACTTSTASGFRSFNVEYDPEVGGGWFALRSGYIYLVEVGSGRGYKVNGARCHATTARAALTRRGIVGDWLVYQSAALCVLPGRTIVHVRGTVSPLNLFTGSIAVRMQPSGRRVAYLVFDRKGTARAFVSRRCS